jgi:hypothetical protein
MFSVYSADAAASAGVDDLRLCLLFDRWPLPLLLLLLLLLLSTWPLILLRPMLLGTDDGDDDDDDDDDDDTAVGGSNQCRSGSDNGVAGDDGEVDGARSD